MNNIIGYGEDSLTFWALKNKLCEILDRFGDKTPPSNCVLLYRPSFGRSGGEKSPEFGEFDAIIVSQTNVYLIESKWDNFTNFKRKEINLKQHQVDRHRLMVWYIKSWSKEYEGQWSKFVRDYGNSLENKIIAPDGKLLTRNLEYILKRIHEHCHNAKLNEHIKNVLLFFYDSQKSEIPLPPKGFDLVGLDYSKFMENNFIRI